MKKQLLTLAFLTIRAISVDAQQPSAQEPVRKALTDPRAPAAAAKADSLLINRRIIMDSNSTKKEPIAITCKKKSCKKKKHKH
ncbi:MAG: hypothetical protein J0H92_09135 [Sphingobacteriales bacterium]|jgi:hypothetical protein|nr:hypothetical protein [Sphingobacteriales bacterium]NCT76587.1 hypothetical protein [Chitinophagaceae bacterium]OJW33533.1 MAG: hypothetical protein BGO54_09785 [Sphingobacteriales bacterium 46-32]